MAVVFPAPAGAIASCSRAPELHICRTSEACPASRSVLFAAIKQSQIHRRLIDHCPVAAAGGGNEALLGVEDPLRGVEVGTGHLVDRGAVGTPQHLRLVDAVTRRDKGHRPTIQHLVDQQIHQHACPLDGHIRRADLALCLGADMPYLPGGATFLHHGQDVISRLSEPAGVGDRGGLGSRGERRLHHRRDGGPSAQHCCRFVQPGRALLGEGSWFMFGVAGLQSRRCARCRASTGVGGRP
jgi:hypothetical protein